AAASALVEVTGTHRGVRTTRITLHAAGRNAEAQRRRPAAQRLVGRERFLAHGRMPELAMVAEVGDAPEERHVAIGETTDDAHLLLLGALRDLGKYVVVTTPLIERVKGAQHPQDGEQQNRGAGQAAGCGDVGPCADRRTTFA